MPNQKSFLWKYVIYPYMFVRVLWSARDNLIAIWPERYFRRDILVERWFSKKILFINLPSAIQWVMATNSRNYRKSVANTQTLQPLVGNGLFVSEGGLWERQRRVATPAVVHERLPEYSRTITEVCGQLIREWADKAPSFELDVTHPFTRLTAEIISRIMFNYPLNEDGERLISAFREYQLSHGRIHLVEFLGLPRWLPRPGARRARRAVAEFDNVLTKIIRNQNRPAHINDLITMLTAFRDEDGRPMAADLVRDEVASMFLAGHETTALTLTWAFYLLSRHSKAEAKLHAELDRVLDGKTPTFRDLEKLQYTRAVVDETLRLYPPVHVFSRQAINTDQVDRFTVPAGSFVVVSSYVLHRHTLYWPDPNSFIPERFLPENAKNLVKYAYIPFGAGPRTCLGKHLGLLEAVLLLAMISQNFRLQVKEKFDPEPIGRMTLRPKLGMPMRVEPRKIEKPSSEAPQYNIR